MTERIQVIGSGLMTVDHDTGEETFPLETIDDVRPAGKDSKMDGVVVRMTERSEVIGSSLMTVDHDIGEETTLLETVVDDVGPAGEGSKVAVNRNICRWNCLVALCLGFFMILCFYFGFLFGTLQQPDESSSALVGVRQRVDNSSCTKCPVCLQLFFDGCLDPEKHRIRSHKNCYDWPRGPLCSRFIWECPGAGIYFTSPMVTAVEMTDMYSKHYHGQAKLQANSLRVQGQFDFIRRNVLDNKKYQFHVPATMMEIGCAGGFLLAKLSAATPTQKVVCFEATPGYPVIAERNVRQSGVQDVVVYPRIWNASMIPENSVDLFISSHVLEHIPDLCTFLKELYQVMKPGGAVFTEVPNHNDKYVRGVLGGTFHLTLPTPQGLMNIMSAIGFVPVIESLIGKNEFDTVPSGYHIRSIFTKPPHPAITYKGAMGQ